jgi:hypothetical protein
MRTKRYYQVRAAVRGVFWGTMATGTMVGMGALYMVLTGGVY